VAFNYCFFIALFNFKIIAVEKLLEKNKLRKQKKVIN